MREERRGAAASLERPARLRRSWVRRLAQLLGIVGLGAVVIHAEVARHSEVRGDPRPNCATAAHNGLPSAASICRLEFDRTGDLATGVLLARVLEGDDDLAGASQVARPLLRTTAKSDALQILGMVAHDERRNEDAVKLLEEARKLHRNEHRPEELAHDDGVLALTLTDLSKFGEALRRIEECIAQAQVEGGTRVQLYSHLTAAKTLIRIGYWAAAKKELETAAPFAHTGFEQVDLDYQLGSRAQEQGQYASAVALFKRALRPTNPPASSTWTINTELNLAYSLAEHKELESAQHYLDEATLLDTDHGKEQDRTWVGAQIAYRRGKLPLASSLIEKYLQLEAPDDSNDLEDKIDVATIQAQINLKADDLAGAERSARRGVELAEQVRDAQTTLELRPWVLGKRRAPYELLFTALARLGRVQDAAMAFDQWQGRTVQDALTRLPPSASLDYAGMASQVGRLGEWLPVASQAAFAGSADRAAVLRTMHDIDLIALIVADGQVWRLTATHGDPRLSRLTSLADIQTRVDDFRGHAIENALASELGALLVPDEAFRATDDVLYVLVDPQLRGLPVAALRHGATPLIALRPIVRVLRLPESRCAQAAPSGHATVLGVSDKTLPTAQAEAQKVAELLHTTSTIGANATRAALFGAAKDAVLHVAAHGKVGMDGAALMLADGDAPALEISARRLAPSLAVLSACDAAVSDDLELAGSLAAGFLGAGSQHVVATLRSVSDASAMDITTGFYLAGGVTDPPRALARVQGDLAKTDNTGWPYFTVFGPAVCPTKTPDHR